MYGFCLVNTFWLQLCHSFNEIEGYDIMVLERKIYFYRMLLRANGQVVEPQTVFSYINSLPFDETGRYLTIDDGNIRSMFVDSTASPLRIRMGTKRVKGLPIIETMGRTSLLTIPPESGLYEPMHFMIFNNNVVGFENNFYGPRPPSLKSYILNKAPELVDEVELLPLMRHDIHELLARIGEVRNLRLRVNRDMGNYLRDLDDNLPDALAALRRLTDAENIEVILRCNKYSRTGIVVRFLNGLADWISRPEVRAGVDDLKIRARDQNTEEIEEFDLLQQYLLSVKQIVTQDEVHRSVDTNAMYSAINEAYTELRSEINLIINGGNR